MARLERTDPRTSHLLFGSNPKTSAVETRRLPRLGSYFTRWSVLALGQPGASKSKRPASTSFATATDVNVLLIDPMSKACIGRVRNIARAIRKAHRLLKHGKGYVSDEHNTRNEDLL